MKNNRREIDFVMKPDKREFMIAYFAHLWCYRFVRVYVAMVIGALALSIVFSVSINLNDSGTTISGTSYFVPILAFALIVPLTVIYDCAVRSYKNYSYIKNFTIGEQGFGVHAENSDLLVKWPGISSILLPIEKSRNFQPESTFCPINNIYE